MWAGEKGAFTNIRYFLLFLHLPSQKNSARHPAATALMVTKNDPNHSESQEPTEKKKCTNNKKKSYIYHKLLRSAD